MKRLSTGAIWQGLTDSLRRDFALLFAVAAPFTLLVDMALALFGPAPPRSMAEFTPDRAALLMLMPTLIASVAQLALARLIARPGETPRRALGTAFTVLPAYLAAVFLSAIPTGIGLIFLILPGLYILSRLFLTAPVAALEGSGPVATLRRSWDLTAGNAGALMLFLALALLFILGASVLASGVASALASVLTLIGLKAVGHFVAALVPALIGTVISMGSAAAATFAYLQLSENPAAAFE